MAFNRSSLSFDDVRQAFDMALEAPKGIKIRCNSRASAVTLRSRFNYYRKTNRKENAEVYEEGHVLHGKSVYDKLILRIPARGEPDEFVLYIEPHTLAIESIEHIT